MTLIQLWVHAAAFSAGQMQQKGEGTAAVDAKRKEIEARRAAAASKATKTFYKITVKVRATLSMRQASCTAVQHGWRGDVARLAVLHVLVLLKIYVVQYFGILSCLRLLLVTYYARCERSA